MEYKNIYFIFQGTSNLLISLAFMKQLRILMMEKKRLLQEIKKTTLERITLPTTEQSNGLIGQNTNNYVIMRKLMGLIESARKI